jgi:sugar diacid utilization regulator
MNEERFRELARQAGVLIDWGEDIKVGRWGIGGKYENMQKFAELIVKECISIVEEQKECLHEEQQHWHDRDYGYALAVDDASKGIKQFFGVKE